jgi:endonuclease/exonuclease/phosphatase family metal-dependent hydrolase
LHFYLIFCKDIKKFEVFKLKFKVFYFCIINNDCLMKKTIIKIWIVFLLIAVAITIFCLMKPKHFEVKIMSYNVRHCAGMDLVVDYDRTAAVIADNQPDVVAVQELDSMTGRSNRKYQLGELASRTSYFPVFGKAIDYDGGAYGVGVLTKEPPLSTKRIPLPGEEPRVLLVVELKNYVIACTHLDLEESERLASIPLIIEEAQHWEKPFILAGDWNDSPDSQLLLELTKYFTINSGSAYTFPADVPNECIDYVATFKNYPAKTLESVVIDEPEASDHRPVVTRLLFRTVAYPAPKAVSTNSPEPSGAS